MNLFDVQTTYLDGQDIDWSEYKGNVTLVVNTASECGLKGQLSDMQQIYDQYKEKGLKVLAVPSADFLGQEPKDGADLAQHCSIRHKATYSFTQKGHVRKEPLHPIFDFLTDKKKNSTISGKPWWNFEKFLIDQNGNVVKRFRPWIKPTSRKVTSEIEKLLN